MATNTSMLLQNIKKQKPYNDILDVSTLLKGVPFENYRIESSQPPIQQILVLHTWYLQCTVLELKPF